MEKAREAYQMRMKILKAKRTGQTARVMKQAQNNISRADLMKKINEKYGTNYSYEELKHKFADNLSTVQKDTFEFEIEKHLKSIETLKDQLAKTETEESNTPAPQKKNRSNRNPSRPKIRKLKLFDEHGNLSKTGTETVTDKTI